MAGDVVRVACRARWRCGRRAPGAGRIPGSVTSSGGALIAGGRLAGMVGTYLMLPELLLVAWLPWLAHSLGQYALVA